MWIGRFWQGEHRLGTPLTIWKETTKVLGTMKLQCSGALVNRGTECWGGGEGLKAIGQGLKEVEPARICLQLPKEPRLYSQKNQLPTSKLSLPPLGLGL